MSALFVQCGYERYHDPKIMTNFFFQLLSDLEQQCVIIIVFALQIIRL